MATLQFSAKKMKATVKQIFEQIQSLNPESNVGSSLGTYVTESSTLVSHYLHKELINILPESSLAHKILTSNYTYYTSKQLWIIAYELEKNEAYSVELGERIAKSERREQVKQNESKKKLEKNKAASKEVLDFVKSKGFKLGDYYQFVKNSEFKKEFYSKKYTMDSANAFINNK